MAVRGGGGFGDERQMTTCRGPFYKVPLCSANTTCTQDTLYQGPQSEVGPENFQYGQVPGTLVLLV